MEKLVSVIIPIYNVKGFIERGIKQILAQSYKNIEILLVDDGSTDGSYQECLRWSKVNSNIVVLHQENKGSGSARNLGLEHAKGEYIYFFDIDDELSPNMLQYNVCQMTQKSWDMIVFGYDSIDINYKTKITINFPHTSLENNSELRDIFVEQFVLKMNGFVWNKFYSKEFLDRHHIRFEDQRIQQDEVFNILCYQHIEKILLSSEVLYTYYVHSKGNTRSRYISDRFEIYKSVRQHFENLKSYWKINDNRLDNYLSKRFYDSVMSCILFNLMHNDCHLSKQEKKDAIAKIMSDPYTLEAFDHAEHSKLGAEQSLYRSACRKQNLWQISLLVNLFSVYRKCRIKLISYAKTYSK